MPQVSVSRNVLRQIDQNSTYKTRVSFHTNKTYLLSRRGTMMEKTSRHRNELLYFPPDHVLRMCHRQASLRLIYNRIDVPVFV